MSKNVVYEGHANKPRYMVERGSHESQSWTGQRSFPSLSQAKANAAQWEREGYDTRIVQIGKEVSR